MSGYSPEKWRLYAVLFFCHRHFADPRCGPRRWPWRVGRGEFAGGLRLGQPRRQHIWNNANHLVTTKYRLSKTSPGNLNFVFTDESGLRSFSDYYYITVPCIMSYAVDIICEMFEDFAGLNEYTILMNKLNRLLKSLTLLEKPSFSDIRQLCLDGEVPIICPRCGLKLKMTDKRILKLLQNQCVCIRCRKKIDTSRYNFDWEKIDITFVEKSDK